MVRLLLKKGADPFLLDSEGLGAIHIASLKNYPDIVETLIQFEKDLVYLESEHSVYNQYTPLHFARFNKKFILTLFFTDLI